MSIDYYVNLALSAKAGHAADKQMAMQERTALELAGDWDESKHPRDHGKFSGRSSMGKQFEVTVKPRTGSVAQPGQHTVTAHLVNKGGQKTFHSETVHSSSEKAMAHAEKKFGPLTSIAEGKAADKESGKGTEADLKNADEPKRIGRWESKSGKHWVELHQTSSGFKYKSPGAGGYLNAKTADDAHAELQKKVDSGYFQPDSAKSPMKKLQLSHGDLLLSSEELDEAIGDLELAGDWDESKHPREHGKFSAGEGKAADKKSGKGSEADLTKRASEVADAAEKSHKATLDATASMIATDKHNTKDAQDYENQSGAAFGMSRKAAKLSASLTGASRKADHEAARDLNKAAAKVHHDVAFDHGLSARYNDPDKKHANASAQHEHVEDLHNQLAKYHDKIAAGKHYTPPKDTKLSHGDLLLSSEELDEAIGDLELASKGKSKFINSDGTFKNGFSGCVDFQQSKGQSKDSASRICAFIGRKAGKILSQNIDIELSNPEGKNQYSEDKAEALSKKANDFSSKTLTSAWGHNEAARMHEAAAAEWKKDGGDGDKAVEHTKKAAEHRAKASHLPFNFNLELAGNPNHDEKGRFTSGEGDAKKGGGKEERYERAADKAQKGTKAAYVASGGYSSASSSERAEAHGKAAELHFKAADAAHEMGDDKIAKSHSDLANSHLDQKGYFTQKANQELTKKERALEKANSAATDKAIAEKKAGGGEHSSRKQKHYDQAERAATNATASTMARDGQLVKGSHTSDEYKAAAAAHDRAAGFHFVAAGKARELGDTRSMKEHVDAGNRHLKQQAAYTKRAAK